MAYRMTMPAFDNSGVTTRQVRRQRERLARKGRNDYAGPAGRITIWSSSRYRPHCGKKEIAKNIARMGR